MQKNHKESYADGNMIWVPLHSDGLRQTLFVDTYAGERLFCGDQIDTLSIKEKCDTLFNYFMILLEKIFFLYY